MLVLCSRLLVLAVVASTSLSFRTIRQASCRSGDCVPVMRCPSLRRLLVNPTRESIGRLQKAICGFQGMTSLVCCPDSGPPTDSPPVKPSTLGPTPIGPGPPFQAARSSLLPARCGDSRDGGDRIYGGNITALGAYPWMAAFGYANTFEKTPSWRCAGSLISDRYVLTAAHCADERVIGSYTLSVIRLGEWDLDSATDCQSGLTGSLCAPGPQDFGIQEVVLHPDYNKRARDSDDIALIRLDRPVDFRTSRNYIYPICLPSENFDIQKFIGNRQVIAAGWGLTEDIRFSNVLLDVLLPMVNGNECRRIYPGRYLDKQLCIGGRAGKDSCTGDSGGPVILPLGQRPPYFQLGIVSFGRNPCGVANSPAVYTSVQPYVKWIKDNMKP